MVFTLAISTTQMAQKRLKVAFKCSLVCAFYIRPSHKYTDTLAKSPSKTSTSVSSLSRKERTCVSWQFSAIKAQRGAQRWALEAVLFLAGSSLSGPRGPMEMRKEKAVLGSQRSLNHSPFHTHEHMGRGNIMRNPGNRSKSSVSILAAVSTVQWRCKKGP